MSFRCHTTHTSPRNAGRQSCKVCHCQKKPRKFVVKFKNSIEIVCFSCIFAVVEKMERQREEKEKPNRTTVYYVHPYSAQLEITRIDVSVETYSMKSILVTHMSLEKDTKNYYSIIQESE